MNTADSPAPYVVSPEDIARPEWADASYNVDDASGYWYAYGRLDQGHPAVVIEPSHGPDPSQSVTAWHFGRMWAAVQHEYRNPDGRGGAFPGLPSAWDNYVASGGRTLYRS